MTTMTIERETLADAFNEWMRRYTEDPAAFEAEFNTVANFRRELPKGKPTYGFDQADYLLTLVHQQTHSAFVVP